MSEFTDSNQAGFDEHERLLQEAVQAENAGVFSRSPVDPVALLASPAAEGASTRTVQVGGPTGSHRWLRVARVALPIAACVVIWFGLRSGGLGPSQVAEPAVQSTVIHAKGALADGDSDCQGLSLFNSCITGPVVGSLTGKCACVDIDQDGDVDLVDFGHLQRLMRSQRG
ncbi:MAG: hypothetical protein V3W34_07270 [Phycisphaerae bacterium]